MASPSTGTGAHSANDLSWANTDARRVAAVYWVVQASQPGKGQLLSSSQAIVSSYTTDAFGNNISSSGTAANPFKWNGGSGYYADAESGLQKVGARYYDPSVGSWISQDTLLVAGSAADSQAVNRYLYCEANPVGSVDASGQSNLGDDFGNSTGWTKQVLGIVVGLVVGTVIATILPGVVTGTILYFAIVVIGGVLGNFITDAAMDLWSSEQEATAHSQPYTGPTVTGGQPWPGGSSPPCDIA